MRYIASTQLVEGMTLGQDIYDGQGRLLISRYSELKQSAIDDLLRAGTPGVYIEDEFSKDIQIQEVVSPEIRRNALKAVHDMFTTSTEGSIAGGEEQDVNAWAQPFSWTLTDNVPGEGAKFYCTAGGLGVEWITIEYELDFGTAE